MQTKAARRRGGTSANVINGKDRVLALAMLSEAGRVCGLAFCGSGCAAVTCNRARSLLGSQATHSARTTCPEAKSSHFLLLPAWSSPSGVSAMQCEHVSRRPQDEIHTAVPASS